MGVSAASASSCVISFCVPQVAKEADTVARAVARAVAKVAERGMAMAVDLTGALVGITGQVPTATELMSGEGGFWKTASGPKRLCRYQVGASASASCLSLPGCQAPGARMFVVCSISSGGSAVLRAGKSSASHMTHAGASSGGRALGVVSPSRSQL